MAETYDRKQPKSANEIVFIISVLIAVLALIGSYAYNKQSEIRSMERNIDSAISKGIDPLAVRCAYGDTTWICMQYASAHGKESNLSKK